MTTNHDERRLIPPVQTALREFLRTESAGGIVLAIAALLALVAANTTLRDLHTAFLETPVRVGVGALLIDKPLILWINDGLMAIFFLVVGAEIKREVSEGQLSNMRRAALPAIGAVGGMLVPGLVYVALNWSSPETLRGWAIPTATDIAFALGVLALLGSRVPASLKVFLLALAIIDDLGAILVIAFFYTDSVAMVPLALAGGLIVAMVALNLSGVTRLAPYMLLGVLLWVCVLKSGVHATLAGVATAFLVPLGRDQKGDIHGPLERLEHGLHPWVTFAILPLFAFANAGLPLAGLSLDGLLAPVPLGILAGLFVGKQIGVMLFSWGAVRAGLAEMPAGANWMSFYGVAVLTGIGFTMSLFIGNLAFADPAMVDQVRLGVLAGSLASALVGAALVVAGSPRRVVAPSASG